MLLKNYELILAVVLMLSTRLELTFAKKKFNNLISRRMITFDAGFGENVQQGFNHKIIKDLVTSVYKHMNLIFIGGEGECFHAVPSTCFTFPGFSRNRNSEQLSNIRKKRKKCVFYFDKCRNTILYFIRSNEI